MQVTPLNLSVPTPGELIPVNPYIYWLRMPLPFDLDHINLYLIKDDGGWAILDTGIGTHTTEKLWCEIFEKIDMPITRVIVTHMHPDHIGMAGYLVEKFKVPLHMSFGEYFVARALVAGARGADNWQDLDYFRKCGLSDQYIERAAENKGGISKVVKPIPIQYRRLVDGESLEMAGVQWQVLIGKGHSPEHVCLYASSINTLISGDHVLPEISPNIGAYSTEPEANPLALYLDTLQQFLKLPEETIVLPSHKLPFTGLHDRVNGLVNHHLEHLGNILAFCSKPRTVNDILPVLFKRELNSHNVFFAIAEALAHLNYLFYEQKLFRSVNEDGQWVFSKAT